MSNVSRDGSDYRPAGIDQAPPPGRQALVMAALVVGVVLLTMQLWLLTIALNLYLAADNAHVWVLAVISGAVFVGGLLALRLFGRRPRVRR